MLSPDDLKKIYDINIKDKLTSLNQLRINIVGFIVLKVIIAISALAVIFDIDMFLMLALPYETALAIRFYIQVGIGVAALVGFIILTIKNSGNKKLYRKAYKEEIVSEIIKNIDPSWVYKYKQSISRDDYSASGIFKHSVDRYSGDDLIEGKINKTNFAFSELHSQYKTTTTDSKGNRKTTWHTIFNGIFLYADFNKSIKGSTFVFPDMTGGMMGWLGEKLQARMKAHGELVKLENVEFEKTFVVYSSDQVESRYILTPKMMEKILNIKKRYKRNPLHISFTGNRVYCALSFGKPLFEPKIFSSAFDYSSIVEINELLSIVGTIIEEMELNTRIWTKQ